jgi:3-hydroxyisobutyrate dehydrogenase-like beta-hydroxyacid dehydrogenase
MARSPSWSAPPADSFAKAKPVLDAMGDKVFHVGQKPGQGATVKTVNQLLCGVHIAVAAEALSLAQKAGINGALLFEIMGGSAASSWMLRDRGPRMLEDEPPVASAVDIFVKDLGIVLDAGRAAKAAPAARCGRAPDVPRRLGPRPWRTRRLACGPRLSGAEPQAGQ